MKKYRRRLRLTEADGPTTFSVDGNQNVSALLFRFSSDWRRKIVHFEVGKTPLHLVGIRM